METWAPLLVFRILRIWIHMISGSYLSGSKKSNLTRSSSWITKIGIRIFRIPNFEIRILRIPIFCLLRSLSAVSCDDLTVGATLLDSVPRDSASSLRFCRMDAQSEKPTASLAPPKKPKMGAALSVKKENAPEFSDKENETLTRVSCGRECRSFSESIQAFSGVR